MNARIEENLLFGVLAFQRRMISEEQFAEAGVLWSVRFDKSLADLLVERGHLSVGDRRDLNRDVVRVLEKHGGDPRESLRRIANFEAQEVLGRIDQPDVRQSLAGLTRTGEPDSRAGADSFVSRPTVLPESSPTSASSRYSLIREHAEGGLGKILLALDVELHRQVALKEIKPKFQSDEESRRRFLKEAQITGQLEHPNIVPVYELARRPDDDQPFYAMRFIEGRTLGDAIADYHARRQRDAGDDLLEFRRLLDAFVSVCNAIAYAHSRGVIHRDLKPANVVLGEFGVVVVLDWGLAKVIDRPDRDAEPGSAPRTIHLSADSQTQTAGMSGTPAYMSPEQAEGRADQATKRTDVYGLGAILFETLTGRAPFIERSAAEVVRRIAACETPRVRSVRSDVPKVLDAICAKAMAKKPEDRYVSAAELGQEVLRWLADEPVVAATDPWGIKIRRWIKRHPALAASAASVMLVALIAFAAFAVVQKQHNDALTQSNQLAEAELDLALEAIQSFYGEAAEDAVLNNPDPALEKLRLRLLTVPQGFYERLVERLRTADAVSPRSRKHLGDALFQLGKVNYAKGSKETALNAHLGASKIFASLAQADPVDVDAHAALALALNNLGAVYMQTNRIEKAELAHNDALRIRRRLAQANALARGGRHAEAVRETLALGESSALGADDHYNRACMMALSVSAAEQDAALEPAERQRLASAYGAEAVGILRGLEKSGFFREPAYLEALRQDSDLNALRGRADFTGLLGDLLFPADPFR